MKTTRRSFLKVTAAGMTGLALSPATRAAKDQNGPGRNFVLVHGAWHGGWCWKRVTKLLANAGHRVFTPTLTGLGDRKHLLSSEVSFATHYQDVMGTIEWEELEDVILVGHSLGGVTISGVADQMPERIKQVIYLDAVLLESGSRWSEAVPPEVAVTRRKLAQESTGGLSLPPPKASVFGIYPAADQAWVERRMTPQPFRTFDEVIHLAGPLGNHLPKIYIDCVEPALPTLVAMKTLYRGRADWPFVEIKCGHDAMIAAPAELAQILLRFV